jgi:S-(hydroxymethyl)glutathione dehydrogenase/alcohol dehydrogenase
VTEPGQVREAAAAVSDGSGRFEVKEIIVHPPEEAEVLVRLGASGVCHTDFDHLGWSGPEVMGHEGAGTVLEVGADISSDELKPGDRVVLNWAIPCGRCFQCSNGAQHLCEDKPVVPPERVTYEGRPLPRSFGLGTMSELTVVRREAVTKIPDRLPLKCACILGCGVMTGFGSAVNAAAIAPRSSVAVIGVGGVGLSVVQGAVYCGAGEIIAVDRYPSRLEQARRLGCTETVVAPDSVEEFGQVTAAVRGLTDGRGVDYAFECTAVPRLGWAPLALVRNGGTAVAVSGIEQPIEVDMELFEWDKLYINPLYGQCRPARDFPLLARLYEDGLLKLEEMITRTYGLDQLGPAFEDMHDGTTSKGVILLDRS